MRYGTRMLKAGDVFEASSRDARLLLAIGRATAIQADPVAAKIVKPTEEQAAKIAAAIADGSPIDALRNEYRDRTGKDADRRWGVPRLTVEVSALRDAV